MSAPLKIGVMPRVAATEIQVWWSPPVSQWVAVGYNSGNTVSIARSPDGITWTGASNNPFSGGAAYGIAYSSSQNKWVAVGNNSDFTVCIATSPDGMTWTDSSNNPFSLGYSYGIAYSSFQNKWVAVGNNYISGSTVSIASSPDGMTWTDASNNPFSGGGANGIAWNGTYWVAVGGNSDFTVSIATSLDGMTWTDASNNPFSTGLRIAYSSSQNKWVAVGVGLGVCIATSPDGMTWTDSSNNPFSGGIGYGIAFSGSQWVAVGYNLINSTSTVCIATSPDGMTWTDSSNNPFYGGLGNGIAYSSSQNQWVAVGRNIGQTVCIATSPDGMTWTPSQNNPFSGAYTTGIASSSPPTVTNYVLQTAVPYVGANESNGGGQLVYSGDGVNWFVNPTILSSRIGKFEYGNGLWLAAGDISIGQIYYSSDGLNWNSSFSFPIGQSIRRLLYRNGLWVAAAYGPGICYSTDGFIWNTATTPLSYECYSLEYGKDNFGNNLWVAIGSLAIAYSPDAINWTMGTNNELIQTGVTVTYGKDASNNSLWVASGRNPQQVLTYSYNGKIWYYNENGSADMSNNNTTCMAYANGVWVLGTMNALYYSHDGLRFTSSVSANSFLAGVYSIAYGKDKWIAAGTPLSSDAIIYSTDGVTWYSSLESQDQHLVAYGDTNPIIIPASQTKGTYTVTGLTPLTDYTYMIQADCSGSYSDIAVYRTVKTSGRPQPVTGLTKSQGIVDGQLRVTFSWSTPSDYAQYYVYGLRVKGQAASIYEGQDIITIGNSYTFTVDPTREYTFSIQRGNDAGYSSLVSIDTVATTFDPRSVPGLWLWLDANDVGNGFPVNTEFSVWKDKSGKENDAVLGAGAEPATVTDGGAGKYVSIGSTWFNLTKSSWAYNQYFTFFVVEHRVTSEETIYIANRNNGADKIKIGYTDSASVIFSTYADNTILGSIDGINPPRINVLCFTNYGGKTAYWNKSISGKNINASFIVDSLLTIGTSTNVGRNEVYEVLMYRGIMKEDDREAITNYLYDKWMPSSSVIQGPVQNGMLMWLDAADKATLIKDASGNPVEDDGDAVYQWKDKSGLGNDMFDLSGNSQYNLASGFPLFAAGANVSTNSIIQTNDATVFLLLYTVDTDYATRTLFTHDISGNYGLIITPTGKLSWRSGPTANNNQINFVAERFFLFYGTIKKGQLLSGTFIDQDGVQKVYDVDSFSYSLGSSPIQLTNLGTNAVRYGEVIYYNRALSDAELEVNAEYLANKWGLINYLGVPPSAPGFSGFSTAFKPTDVSGASLWLDASEENFVYGSKNRIQTWKDKTGNCIVKQDVPWAQPIYSLDSVTGLHGVQFGADAIANGLVSDSPFGSGNSWSVFTVHRYDYSTDLDEAVNGCVCTVYEASSGAPTAFKAGSTFVTLENGVVPSELKLTEGSSAAISADVRGRPVMTGQLVNSLTPTHTVNGADYPIGGLLVAVGNNIPYIAISTDGMTWTDASNNPFTGGRGNGIAYSSSQNKWVAVGNNGDFTVCIATSPDGMTWTDSSNNPFSGGYGNGIAYSPYQDKWVAVGMGITAEGCIASSTDGITWTPSTINPLSGGQAYGIAASTSLWVAVGRNSDFTVCIATSPDGMTWTDSSNNPFSGGIGCGIAFSGSQWVAVGYNLINSTSTVCIATSPDGMTWTDSSNNPFSGGIGYGIAFSGSYWVAVGSGTAGVCIATSPDGMTWTDASNNPFSGGQGNGIAWNGSYWVAVGANSWNTVSIATSPDGMTWTPSQNNPFPAAVGNAVASSPPQPLQPMANARMNIGFTAPLTPALGGAMRGYIYEILCYKGAVSPSDQQKIEGYLAWKWGIQDVLAQTHPYYLGPP